MGEGKIYFIKGKKQECEGQKLGTVIKSLEKMWHLTWS